MFFFEFNLSFVPLSLRLPLPLFSLFYFSMLWGSGATPVKDFPPKGVAALPPWREQIEEEEERQNGKTMTL